MGNDYVPCFLQWQGPPGHQGVSLGLGADPLPSLEAPTLSEGLGRCQTWRPGPTGLRAVVGPQTSPRPGVRGLYPELLSSHQHPSLPGHTPGHTQGCPNAEWAPHLQIQNAAHRDGEEFRAAPPAHHGLQGAAARAGRVGLSPHHRPQHELPRDTGPSKVPRRQLSWTGLLVGGGI